jgi:hypothetical protein
VLRAVQIQGEGSFVYGVSRCLIPLLGASKTLKIVKNRLEMRKLWPSKVGGSRTQNNKPQPILEHPKTSFYVALLLL